MLKVASVQMDIQIGQPETNLECILDKMSVAAGQGAQLIVFPESTLAGYCFGSLDEGLEFAQTLDGPELSRISDRAKELGVHCVAGFLERDGERLFNTAVCVGPDGIVGTYRKIHLPFLGIDRFTTPGDRLEVFTTPGFRLGMNICYDCSFPESMRVLMLGEADIVALPTNWPPTSGRTADVIPAARALENHIYVIVANRVGEERGFQFIGKSRICDPRGATLAVADHNREEILYADVDVLLARKKHLVNIPGVHEVHRVDDRQPGVYGPLTAGQPASRRT